MADNPIDINSIPFGHIIGEPLAACVMAQADAAQTTRNYISQALMKESKTNPNELTPKSISFTFELDGVKTKMIVPLLTIVPIPYMRIEHVDLSFTAEVTESNEQSLVARYTAPQLTADNESNTSTEFMSIINVDIHATTADMPSGVAKLLDLFANKLVRVETSDARSGTKPIK